MARFAVQRILAHTVGPRFASIAVCGLLWLAAPLVFAQSASSSAPRSELQQQHYDAAALQKHYDAAERLQQAGQMKQAAAEYRAFIAEAVGQLAGDYAGLGEYQKAAPLFDESLEWKPDQPALRIEYAEATLAHGDFDHAKSLAEQMLKNNSAATEAPSKKELAKAHLIAGRALLKLNRDREARKELETAVALDPNFADGYALAVACLDMDDGKCAGRVFAGLQSSFGDTAPIHMEFGLAYGHSDFPQRAISEFQKAISENTRLPEAHYSLAAAYLASAEASSLQKAEVELKKELQVSPNDFLTYAALGHIAVIQHRYKEAEKYLKRAIALNPSNPDAYLYLGQMDYEMHRSAEAEAALREAIAKTTDVSRNRYQIQKAHYLLGRLLIKSGHASEAQAEMRIVQQLMARTLTQDKDRLSGVAPQQKAAGEMGSGTIRVANMESEHKPPPNPKAAHALAAFEKEVSAPLADSYNNLGAIAASSKDYATALIDFQHAAEWNPALPGLDYNRGRAAFMASRFQDAVPPLTRYLNAHLQDKNIRSVLAISLFMTRNYAAVVKTLQPILAGIDAVPQVEYVYAASLVKTGQKAAGVARLTAMEKKNPSIPDVHRSLGEAYAEGGTAYRSKAAEEFATAIRLNPNDAEAHSELGRLDLQTGDVKGAIAQLQTAVRLDPGNRETHSELAAAYGQVSQRQRKPSAQSSSSDATNR